MNPYDHLEEAVFNQLVEEFDALEPGMEELWRFFDQIYQMGQKHAEEGQGGAHERAQ